MSAERLAGTARGGGAARLTIRAIALVLWNCDHDDGKARYGITLVTHSADPTAADNREAWFGYMECARRVRRLLRESRA